MSSLRKHVPGIRGVLLTRDRKILTVDLNCHENRRFLDRTVYCLFKGMYGNQGAGCSVSTAESDRFFILFHNSYELGVVASQDVEMALLTTIVSQELDH
ncbi:MAG: hypothetical protein HXS41_13630 [Theionarchaea archaeon]|nr:hypothetical protein [Theionarchaea archaeon]MBU7001227.1 hypothetical protein [Theionarchaea archaeon]MBU7022091.1 hypothetical protein [Theionarchaea archaeon]MBU7035654.1 hypothetical protein [Theionarchaea archaeon]MBU7040849.1 hypothetical protein [Theionarchaea archaeon]